MTPKSTIYHFDIDLSDIDRGVYHSAKLPVALHPSESVDFMLTRVLAWALEWSEGISFSRGIGSPDEPTISVKSLDGRCLAWIEIGTPSAERLHKAAKAAGRVAVYCHRSAEAAFLQLSENGVLRGDDISFLAVDGAFISRLGSLLEKRNSLQLSRSDERLYVTLNGESSSCALHERRLGPDT